MTDSNVTDPILGRRMWADYMEAVLVEAQKKRRDPHLQQWVETSEGHEFAWVLYERAQMLKHVNKAREGIGRPPVAEAAVRAAERQAEGHSDYTRKWALYCAELILGLAGETQT